MEEETFWNSLNRVNFPIQTLLYDYEEGSKMLIRAPTISDSKYLPGMERLQEILRIGRKLP